MPVPRSIDQMSPPSAYQPSTSPGSSLPVGRLARAKASRFPSGDQAGWMSSFGTVVSWRSAPVARSLTNSFLKPPTSCEKASCFPSGDQAGHSSTPSWKVSCTSFVVGTGGALSALTRIGPDFASRQATPMAPSASTA